MHIIRFPFSCRFIRPGRPQNKIKNQKNGSPFFDYAPTLPLMDIQWNVKYVTLFCGYSSLSVCESPLTCLIDLNEESFSGRKKWANNASKYSGNNGLECLGVKKGVKLNKLEISPDAEKRANILYALHGLLRTQVFVCVWTFLHHLKLFKTITF